MSAEQQEKIPGAVADGQGAQVIVRQKGPVPSAVRAEGWVKRRPQKHDEEQGVNEVKDHRSQSDSYPAAVAERGRPANANAEKRRQRKQHEQQTVLPVVVAEAKKGLESQFLSSQIVLERRPELHRPGVAEAGG